MANWKLNARFGFTLVEVLVTTLIFSLAVTVMYGMQRAIADFFYISAEKTDLQAKARIALELMRSELKNATRTSTSDPAANLSIPPPPSNTSITFYLGEDKDGDGLITDPKDGQIDWATTKPIYYQFVPAQKQLRRLKPSEDTNKILATDVADIRFIDASIDNSLDIHELRIILTLNKITPTKRNLTFTLPAIVRLRN